MKNVKLTITYPTKKKYAKISLFFKDSSLSLGIRVHMYVFLSIILYRYL